MRALESACRARHRLRHGPYLVSRRAGAEEEGRREVAAPEPGDGGAEEGKEEDEEEETRHDGGQLDLAAMSVPVLASSVRSRHTTNNALHVHPVLGTWHP